MSFTRHQIFINSTCVLALIIALAFVMRFFSFFPSVIDHDESTYILIADSMRHGDVYLRDVMDTKPVGIFILFAFFQTLFGKSIIAIRIITTIWIALTAWIIYLVHRKVLDEKISNTFNTAPLASGIIYIFMTSIYTTHGVAPNTELFFNLFTIIALLLIISYTKPGWYFLAGILFGLGFMIKYVVLFDAIAIGLFYIWLQLTAKNPTSYWLIRCILMGTGFLLPFLITWGVYIQMKMGAEFWFYSFEFYSRYVIETPWHANVRYVLDNLLRFLPVTVWFIYCIWNWRPVSPSLSKLGSIWVLFILIIILLPGRFYPHYFIQCMLPLSLVAGSFFDTRRSPGPVLSWIRKRQIGYPILVLIIMVNLFFQKKDYLDKPDLPEEIATFLNTQFQPGDVLYTGDFHPITYHLTRTKSPTPFIHKSLIWEAENSYALNIDMKEELNKIMQQKPRFILMNFPLKKDNPLYTDLELLYVPLKTFGQKVTMFERK